jgi:hypothetical protein
VLAQRGAFRLAGSQAQQRLAFTLTATARVWAEAEGLWGLAGQDQGDAPEAFMDDAYAGPLLAEHGGGWRSPQAFLLGPGPHALLLRASTLRAAAAAAGGSALKALSDPLPVLVPAPTPPPCGCAEAPYRRDWPARLKGQGLVLSVLSGRLQSAGLMAALGEHDAWECQVRLPAPDGKPLALMAGVRASGPGGAVLALGVDPDYHGPAQALGYTPGAWEPLRLQWCQGRLTVRLAHAPEWVAALSPGPLALQLAAQGLELGLAPAPPLETSTASPTLTR